MNLDDKRVQHVDESSIKIDLDKYFKLDDFTKDNETVFDTVFGKYYYILNDEGVKKYQSFIQDLKSFAENGEYGSYKNESTWIENYEVYEDCFQKDTSIELFITEDFPNFPKTLQDLNDELDFDDCKVTASWKAIREEGMGKGSWWRITVNIPIGDILFLNTRQIQKRIELGDYENNLGD